MKITPEQKKINMENIKSIFSYFKATAKYIDREEFENIVEELEDCWLRFHRGGN